VFPTAEVRWFWQGDVPDAALTWLSQQPGGAPSENTRTDHYLIVDSTDTLGVKLRGGNIELKQRTATPRPRRWTDQAHGLAERWTKWSFDLARERPVLNQLAASQAWVGVTKTRWLKEYRITPDDGVLPLRTDEASTAVCAVEITQVSVSNARPNRWWTLGLEASGNEGRLNRALDRTASALLDASVPAAMTRENSYGYAQWLRLLRVDASTP
jgi:hypothetical protein